VSILHGTIKFAHRDYSQRENLLLQKKLYGDLSGLVKVIHIPKKS